MKDKLLIALNFKLYTPHSTQYKFRYSVNSIWNSIKKQKLSRASCAKFIRSTNCWLYVKIFRSSVRLLFFLSAPAMIWHVFWAGALPVTMTHIFRSFWIATRNRRRKCWIDGALWCSSAASHYVAECQFPTHPMRYYRSLKTTPCGIYRWVSWHFSLKLTLLCHSTYKWYKSVIFIWCTSWYPLHSASLHEKNSQLSTLMTFKSS